MAEQREAMLATKRQENFELSRKMGEAPGRFGLFTSPAPLAVSDPQFPQKKPRLVPDADVKEVASDPPNIRTNPVKKGNIESVLFAKPSYNAIGDPFKEAAQTMLRREDREAQIKAGNDKRFKPARAVRQPVVSAYEHMQDFIQVEKNFRSDENPREVVTAPRNFLTNPPKVGKCGKMTTFAGQVPYMNEGFDIPKQLAAKEIERSHALRDKVHNGKNFSQKAKQTHLFNSHKDVLHDPKANGPLTREARHRSPPLMEHDKPFKPSNPPKRGYNKSLAPFPVYIPDPKKGLERKRDEEDGPPQFKPQNNASRSRPTPSIQCNLRNLKASFPSVFRR